MTEKRKLPLGCSERYEKIHQLADEFHQTFVNGNRKDLVAGLVELPPHAGLAVLAVIMDGCSEGDRESIRRFLVEVA